MHAALKAFTGSDPQKLLECTVGAAVPNPNPPAGASRSRACPAVPARSPWVQLVTRRDAGNRISPIRSSVLPSSAPLPTQPQPKRRKSRRVAKCLLSFGELGRAWISKESRSPGFLKSLVALAIVAAPEARDQWSLLSAALTAAASGHPQRGGRVVPTAPSSSAALPPPAPRLGLSQGQAPIARRQGVGGEEPSFVPGEAKGTKLGRLREDQPASQVQGPRLLLKEKGHFAQGPPPPHPTQRESQPCTQEAHVLADAAGQRQS